MRSLEDTRLEVRERIEGMLAERRRDALADLAWADRAPDRWRWLDDLASLVGLALIRLGERLRGEIWAPSACRFRPPLLVGPVERGRGGRV
jgi:hypothetical protein